MYVEGPDSGEGKLSDGDAAGPPAAAMGGGGPEPKPLFPPRRGGAVAPRRAHCPLERTTTAADFPWKLAWPAGAPSPS